MNADIKAGDVLALLNIAGQAYLHAQESYSAARQLAEKAGVTEEDLAAADARFAKVFTDPLAE